MKTGVPSEELITEAAGYSVTSDAARTPTGDHIIGGWQELVKHCDRISDTTNKKNEALQRLARIKLMRMARDNPNFLPETTEALIGKWEAECAANMQAEIDNPKSRV